MSAVWIENEPAPAPAPVEAPPVPSGARATEPARASEDFAPAAIEGYATRARCRQQVLCNHFTGNDDHPRCGACDVCDAAARGDAGVDTETATAVVELLGLVGALRGRFGRTRVAALATGADDDPRFEELPERGCLRGWSQKDIMDLLRTLEGAALLEASRGEYPTVGLTRRGEQVAAGTLGVDTLGLRVAPRPAAAARTRKPRRRKRGP